MARTRTQVEQSIGNRILALDNTVDTLKGAVPDMFIIPEAAEIRSLEQRQDSIGLRYSFDYVKLQDRDVQVLYGANHGLRPSRGSPSTARGVAYRFTRPTQNVGIPAGTLVTTVDETLTFQTAYDVVMEVSRADSYYNAAKRRYEVPVQFMSVGFGSDFETPARTIRKLPQPVIGIDGMENTERSTPATASEGMTEFASRVQKKFNGLEYASADGLRQLVIGFAPKLVQDVIPVFSSDNEFFQRRTRRAAWDLYVRGSRIEDTETVFTSTGSPVFVLPSAPVISVSSVLVNNLASNFTFTPDVTPERRGSGLEYSTVQLPTAPPPGASVTVRYQWDSLIGQTQAYVNSTHRRSYRTDILIRRAWPVPVRIRVEVQPASTFDTDTVLARVTETVYQYINDTVRREIVMPEQFRSYLLENASGVAKLWVKAFTLASTGTLDVEPIELAPYEYVTTDDTLLTVVSV